MISAARRQHYLGALGLTPWVPRVGLPSAAPSPIRYRLASPSAGDMAPISTSVANQSVESHASQPSAPKSIAKPSPSRDALLASLHGDTDKVIVARGISSAEVVSRVPPAKPDVSEDVSGVSSDKHVPVESEAAFELACFAIGPYLVVDDFSAFDCASSAYWRWWADILNGTDLACDKQWQRFQWPLPGKFTHQRNTQAARETLGAWFSRRLTEASYTGVLLMGQAPQQWLLSEEKVSLGQWQTSTALPLPVLCTHGTSSLWQQPQLKREFWQHMAHCFAKASPSESVS
ncbi:hypothetical protein GYB62_00940 [bacterium]|nr:hypothetical protein [bacterium]